MNWSEFEKWCAALCAWREARGEPNARDSMRAVIHVIKNRADAGNKPWQEIVYAPLQFSSMTYAHDPQLWKVPVTPDPQFAIAYELADAIYHNQDFDLTEGATHYFNPGLVMPPWAAGMKKVATIGHHDFYK